MVASPVTIQAEVGENRTLTIKLPRDMPIGPVEVVIRPLAAGPAEEREQIKAALRAVGALSEETYALPDTEAMTDEELEVLSRSLAGKPSVDDMLNEDRGMN